MKVSVYRCRAAFLVVPSCFLPSLEALNRYGEARLCGSIRLDGPVGAEVQAALQGREFVALDPGHPLVAPWLYDSGSVPAVEVPPEQSRRRTRYGRRRGDQPLTP